MKKNDWFYIRKLIWVYAENNERMNQRISRLLKQLVKEINENMEVIINDNDENDKTTRSNGGNDSNTTSNINFEGTGEF